MGMDVSKHWVDIALVRVVDHQKGPMVTERFDNTRSGVEALDAWLCEHGVLFDHHSLLVIENTGVYHRRIWEYCTERGLPLHIGNAAAIKWSLGIARGKSDQIDSRRLCSYAYKNREELAPTPVHNPQLTALKDLLTARTRLLRQLNSIRGYLRELRHSSPGHTLSLLEEAHRAALLGLKASLKAVEEQIRTALKADPSLLNNYKLLLSVPGIGHLTAVYLLCCTHNFVLMPSGKQLACYAGVAPFGSTSGTSIKGKDRVHHMANKDLKKLLHMGAVSASTYHPEFKAYYQRKEAQGKHPLSILNAIRNKIALRAAAVIINQKPYTCNHPQTTLATQNN